MDYPYLDFIRKFLGIYSPQMTTVYVPIETVDVTSGQVYISGYESYTVVAEGLASINVEYIVSAIMFLFMCLAIYKFVLFAVTTATGTRRNSQVVKL